MVGSFRSFPKYCIILSSCIINRDGQAQGFTVSFKTSKKSIKTTTKGSFRRITSDLCDALQSHAKRLTSEDGGLWFLYVFIIIYIYIYW